VSGYFIQMRWVIRIAAHVLLLLAALSSIGVWAMGEKYAEQGGRLSGALRTALVTGGFCKTSQECQKLLPGTAGHGDRVRIAYYEVNDRNIKALSVLINMVVEQGISITSGIPITITAYKESHEEYRKSSVFSRIEPFLVLEMNK